jgi:hypothetical protein
MDLLLNAFMWSSLYCKADTDAARRETCATEDTVGDGKTAQPVEPFSDSAAGSSEQQRDVPPFQVRKLSWFCEIPHTWYLLLRVGLVLS